MASLVTVGRSSYGLLDRTGVAQNFSPTEVRPVRLGCGVTRYVTDAPTLLHLVAHDVQVDARHQIVAPSLIRSQALALLLDAVRRGHLTEGVALKHHERITELKIRLLGDRVSRRTAWTIAREHDWETTYEAEYLAVARLQADALVTIDPALAAKATDVIPWHPSKRSRQTEPGSTVVVRQSR